MKLTISLPTRGRAVVIWDTLCMWLPTICEKDTRVVVAVDEDDEQTIRILKPLEHPNLIVDVRPRELTLGQKFNRAISVAPADVYMILVDYVVITTPGFDSMILEAASRYPDGYAIVRTQWVNLSFPALQAVTAKVADKLGGIYPPYFVYWFHDHWLDDLMKMIGREAYAPVYADCYTRRGVKRGTAEKREPWFWADFYDFMAGKREQEAMSILYSPDFDEPTWRKKALQANWPAIHAYSKAINDIVRADPDPGAPPDMRYLQAKNNATSLLVSQWGKEWPKWQQQPSGMFTPPVAF